MALSITPNPRIAFKVHFRDEDLLVVEKPGGVVTQPGLGHDTDTLLNGLFAQFGPALQNLGAKRDFGLLHRLDRGTSGLLLVALRPRAYDALRADFENRRIRKFYWAVCAKAPRAASGVINRPLLETEPRSGETRLSRPARPGTGKSAVTAYRTLASGPRGALVEARPLTGRLHQVRVHLEGIGAPILGDDLYASPAVAHAAKRLALHAHRLVFTHPVSGKTIDIRAPFPRDLRALLKRLGLAAPKAHAVGQAAGVPDEAGASDERA